MKEKKIIYLERVLRFMAMLILKRHQPKIVGVTGSVGKSSTKEAIFLVLKEKYNVRKNEENYNNEIGIPLTIIGAKTGGKNPFKWLIVFVKWVWGLIFSFNYPEILILELAIDRPGDMKYLMSFIPIDVGVLTNISSSHLEFFKNIKEISKEKMVLIKSVKKNGLAVLNIDNPFIREEKEKLNNLTVTYGFSETADAQASDVRFNYDEKNQLKGLSFKLNYKNKTMPLRLPNLVAKHQLYAALVAVAVADYFKINLIDALKLLEEFKAPYGRMNLIKGINESLIIDDTYNSSPASALAALSTLEQIEAKRRIVVLGDMLELGAESEAGHREVIKNVLEGKFDKLAVVGTRMHQAAREFLGDDNVKSVLFFNSPMEAGKIIKNILEEGDLILVKGSQSMRMEKVVEQIMSEPEIAPKLLCRQNKTWKNKEFKAV